MNAEQFADFLRLYPLVADQLRDLTVTAPTDRIRTLGMMDEVKMQLFLLPILTHILGVNGVPWELEKGRYSDESKKDFVQWAKSRKQSRSTEFLLLTGNRIMKYLQLMKNKELRSGWDELLLQIRIEK